MSRAKMLTMTEAAHELGPDYYEGHESNLGEWMRRRLRAKEAELRMKILVRDGRGYKVARSTLMVAFHERTAHHDKVGRRLAEELGKISTGIRKVDDRVDSIEANIAVLARVYSELMAKFEARKK